MAKARVSDAIGTLVAVFHEYAAKDCEEGQKKHDTGEACKDQFKLSKRELKELIDNDFDFVKVNDQAKLDEFMKELDADGDGQVNFKEFVALVIDLACFTNDILKEMTHIVAE